MPKTRSGRPSAATTEIRVENARSHNLKGVSCSIPLRQLTVITGVSGSGKSTLAFDTLYAEGQRRYVSSLSTYARQFLERLPRPQVDAISNVPPAIAIEQRNTVANARSIVGTATEILDHLRLLFARIGATRCPDCDRPVQLGTAAGVADVLLERHAGQRVSVAAVLVAATGEGEKALRARLLRDGYTRLIDAEDEVVDLSQLGRGEVDALRGSALLLIDRLAVPAAGAAAAERTRLAEAVAEAFTRGDGELVVVPAVARGDRPAARAFFREGFRCDDCGRRFPKPVPALFSFNSPLGACEDCQGFGRIPAIDFERVVPDPSLSLADRAIAPFTTKMGRHLQSDLMAACGDLGIPTDVPFASLSDEQRGWVFEGDEAQGGEWYGVRGFFGWLERRRYKVSARTTIARYRRFDSCAACGGSRLNPDALCVRVDGRTLADVSGDTIDELRDWLAALEPTREEEAQVGRLLAALRARIETVSTVGLGYLGLDRPTRTLSGGEAQRIQLATALGGRLTSSLYVLDEPSIGLHPADIDRLVAVLRRIRDHGNTLVVVEHAPEIVSQADHLIDLGPGAGRAGGELVAEGSVADVRAHPSSHTGRALRGELEELPSPAAREPRGELRIVGAREHNLKDVDVRLPLGQFVVVTGVSGAGKSTLIERVLVGNLLADRDESESGQRGEPGACERIEGGEAVESIVVVDQTPSSRSPRSNPATVSKAFDAIRARFAETREARVLGVDPGWFSFNVSGGGRCEKCEGAGEVVIDMQFLDDVRVPCEVCGGSRYRREVQQVRLDGRSITDVLALTLEEAVEVFADDRRVAGRLEPFVRVGLGYLQLGQPLSTLSGGEHQRVRLAQAMRPRAARGRGAASPRLGTRLFVLDEPTTGLHPADVRVLLGCLEELIEEGASVIVVEHNLDVIRRADFVVDLGPGGGPAGGRVVASGSPAEVAASPESATGSALRRSA
ncbi:MAG: excinuclease ABC subunit UvrA [Myxococcota bacterium]|nr:excinuclease ABC subunit UvrA [Myxococcota bacterium]